jgi:hypothetical protein
MVGSVHTYLAFTCSIIATTELTGKLAEEKIARETWLLEKETLGSNLRRQANTISAFKVQIQTKTKRMDSTFFFWRLAFYYSFSPAVELEEQLAEEQRTGDELRREVEKCRNELMSEYPRYSFPIMPVIHVVRRRTTGQGSHGARAEAVAFGGIR